MGVAIPIPRMEAAPDGHRRLQRLRWLAWLLDVSIPIGRWRIGLDPILGLLPGAGDWIGALLSLYILYEGARLGMPAGVLTRMGSNILVETLFGSIPVLGDLFDFAWKANTRNLTLIEHHYRPGLEPRSLGRIGAVVAIISVVVLTVIGVFAYVLVRAILSLLH